MTLVLRYAARSDRGLVRANNEDSVYAGARLLALADGMGGHAAGEVASQLVIAALAHLDDDEPGGDLLSQLNDAVHQGNAAIAAHVEADPELEGMGTTLTAILFAGNKLGLVHIGDSRGYLLRDGELGQITKDDTFVQTLVDEGRITAEEAHSHPQRSLIMRALTGHEVEPTLIVREARVGDRYLLCSDGLSDPVSQDTILDALQIPDVAESADRLIELALRGGGPDNVTVVVADVVDYGYGQTQPILAGAVSGDDDQTAPPNTAAGRASAFNPRRNAAGPPKRPATEPEPPPRKPRSRRRMIYAAGLLVLLVVAGLAVGREMIRSNYYVAEHDGAVFIMRGVQGSFLGMALQQPFRIACLDGRDDSEDHRRRRRPLRVSAAQGRRSAGVRACPGDGGAARGHRRRRHPPAQGTRPDLAATRLCPTHSGHHDGHDDHQRRATATPAPTPGAPTPGVTPTPPPRPSTDSPSPETPATVTAPAPTPPESAPIPTPTPTPSPTVTALPPPPQEPGTTCRAAS